MHGICSCRGSVGHNISRSWQPPDMGGLGIYWLRAALPARKLYVLRETTALPSGKLYADGSERLDTAQASLNVVTLQLRR